MSRKSELLLRNAPRVSEARHVESQSAALPASVVRRTCRTLNKIRTMIKEFGTQEPHRIDINDEVLELEAAADVLKMSPAWLAKSDVPRAKFGRSVRYLKSELLAYATAHLTHSVKRDAA